MLISANATVVYVKLFPLPPGIAHDPYKVWFMALVIIIIIANMVLFLNKKRVSEIMNRYSGESSRSRWIGGFLVILYALLSFALIVIGP